MWTLLIILAGSPLPPVVASQHASQELCQKAQAKAVKGHAKYAAVCAAPVE